jgi:hypothetical protein
LLFAGADDPLRALRWTLTELRHVLGAETEVGGDPVELALPPDATIDVQLVTAGTWKDAIELPGLGEELLAGLESLGAPEFESGFSPSVATSPPLTKMCSTRRPWLCWPGGNTTRHFDTPCRWSD